MKRYLLPEVQRLHPGFVKRCFHCTISYPITNLPSEQPNSKQRNVYLVLSFLHKRLSILDAVKVFKNSCPGVVIAVEK